MNFNPPHIISDEPEKADLGFGFDRYAQTLAEVIANKKNAIPLVMGIYGSWGSGKTTLMHGIEAELKKINQQGGKRGWEEKDVYRPTKTVWFQAWKYTEEDAILAALIDEIITMIKADAPLFGAVKTQLEKWAKTVEVKGAVSQLISWFTVGTVDLNEIFPDPEFKKKLGFYHEFIRFFDGLIWATLTNTGIKEAKEFNDQKGALVVLIDDLDRCPQTRVLKVLETIKLFLDKKGCVFIIGAAQDVIEDALKKQYEKEDDTKRFMDKIVQVTFALPQPTEQELATYLETKMVEDKISGGYHKLIAQSLKYNARSVKRFLNNLSIRKSLASKSKVDLGDHAGTMIPWTILELGHREVVHLIRVSLVYVKLLQEAARDLEQQGVQKDQWLVKDEILEEAKVIVPLRPYLTNREIIDLVNELPPDIQTLRALMSLTATVGTMDSEESAKKETVLRNGPLGLKEMVRMPAGPFLYGEEKHEKTIEQAFFMDVYPVTNGQFR